MEAVKLERAKIKPRGGRSHTRPYPLESGNNKKIGNRRDGSRNEGVLNYFHPIPVNEYLLAPAL